MKFVPAQKNVEVYYIDSPTMSNLASFNDDFINNQASEKPENPIDLDEISKKFENLKYDNNYLNRFPSTVSNAALNDQDVYLVESMNSDINPLSYFNIDSLPLLLPNDSYAYALTTSCPLQQASSQKASHPANKRVIGNPEVYWTLHMGEHGVIRGDDVILSSLDALNSDRSPSIVNSPLSSEYVQMQCTMSPPITRVGEEFDVQIRITNYTPQKVKLILLCNEFHQNIPMKPDVISSDRIASNSSSFILKSNSNAATLTHSQSTNSMYSASSSDNTALITKQQPQLGAHNPLHLDFSANSMLKHGRTLLGHASKHHKDQKNPLDANLVAANLSQGFLSALSSLGLPLDSETSSTSTKKQNGNSDDYGTKSRKTLPNSAGLCVTGLIHYRIGEIYPYENIDIHLTMCPLLGGLQEAYGFVLIDELTNNRYPSSSLFKVLVLDDNYTEHV
jgi:hypothetical protein